MLSVCSGLRTQSRHPEPASLLLSSAVNASGRAQSTAGVKPADGACGFLLLTLCPCERARANAPLFCHCEEHSDEAILVRKGWHKLMLEIASAPSEPRNDRLKRACLAMTDKKWEQSATTSKKASIALTPSISVIARSIATKQSWCGRVAVVQLRLL
jgi:hypothetical protein